MYLKLSSNNALPFLHTTLGKGVCSNIQLVSCIIMPAQFLVILSSRLIDYSDFLEEQLPSFLIVYYEKSVGTCCVDT